MRYCSVNGPAKALSQVFLTKGIKSDLLSAAGV